MNKNALCLILDVRENLWCDTTKKRTNYHVKNGVSSIPEKKFKIYSSVRYRSLNHKLIPFPPNSHAKHYPSLIEERDVDFKNFGGSPYLPVTSKWIDIEIKFI